MSAFCEFDHTNDSQKERRMEARYARRKTDQGGVMLRKHIFKDIQNRSVPQSGEIDIAATTTVQVTSEDSAHPIDNVFDCRRGPGEAAGWRKSQVSKRCCWRLIHPRPFTRLS
jgi:hypothetical protein